MMLHGVREQEGCKLGKNSTQRCNPPLCLSASLYKPCLLKLTPEGGGGQCYSTMGAKLGLYETTIPSYYTQLPLECCDINDRDL